MLSKGPIFKTNFENTRYNIGYSDNNSLLFGSSKTLVGSLCMHTFSKLIQCEEYLHFSTNYSRQLVKTSTKNFTLSFHLIPPYSNIPKLFRCHVFQTCRNSLFFSIFVVCSSVTWNIFFINYLNFAVKAEVGLNLWNKSIPGLLFSNIIINQ